MSKLLSTNDAAQLLGITSPTLISYANSGKIPASFIARKWRFKSEDLELFVTAQRRGQ